MNIVTGAFFWAGFLLSIVLVVGSVILGWWIPALFALICTGFWVLGGRFVLGAGWRPPEIVKRPTRRPVVRRRPR